MENFFCLALMMSFFWLQMQFFAALDPMEVVQDYTGEKYFASAK
jgi:hypothetical protein